MEQDQALMEQGKALLEKFQVQEQDQELLGTLLEQPQEQSRRLPPVMSLAREQRPLTR